MLDQTPDAMPGSEREERIVQGVGTLLRERRDRLRTQIPVDLERTIRMSLVVPEEPAPKPSFLASLLGAFRRPSVIVASLLVVGGVSFTLLQRQTPTMVPVDLHRVAYSNFESILKGQLTVATATADTVALRSFFAKAGVSYPVFFPAVRAELKGGVVSTDNGHHYAHLVYGVGDHLIYLFEADQASLDAQIAALDTTIVNDLTLSRWHWEERPGTGTMFVWKSNNVVCLAVSDLRTQDMSALFTLEAL